MNTWRNGIFLVASALFFNTSFAAQPTEAEHQQHHPEASVSSAVESQVPDNGGVASMEMMKRCDTQMKAMQEMHERMRGATTPEQRQALYDEHAKLMRSGMAMMTELKGMMKGVSTTGSMMQVNESMMMQKRMDMMEMMMQMMMDRMDFTPAN